MKIYLVQIDYSKDHSMRIIPLGPLYVGSALKKAGYDVELIHCTEKEIDREVGRILNDRPLFIGISVMTGMQTRHSAIMSKKIKQQSEAPIVWGGIHPSLLADMCLKEEYIDIVVVGEGEETAIELAGKLKDGGSLSDVKGIGYKHKTNGRISYHLNPPRPFIVNLDKYRIDFNLVNMENYLTSAMSGRYKRVTGYKTSRGCPYDCGFCYNQEFNKGRWRGYSTGAIFEDIEFLKREYKIDGIRFYDDNFYVDKGRAVEILRGIGIPASSEIRIDMLDEGLAGQIKALNCLGLLVGVETGSERVLKLINKQYKEEDLVKGLEIIKKYELPVAYGAILGFPTETKEEVKKTINLLLSIHGKYSNKNTTILAGIFLPYPGTNLYSLAVREGFSPPNRTEDWADIDRSRSDLSLPWIDSAYVYRIRKYFEFLSYNVALLNKWFRFRIKHDFLLFPWDMKIIEYLSDKVLQHKTG